MEWLIGLLILYNKNSLWSVLLLCLVSIVLTLSWIKWGLTYLGIILTIVYGGAIVILIVYVLFMLDINKLDISSKKVNVKIILWLTLGLLLWDGIENNLITNISDIEWLGILNINKNVLLLWICSILLLLSISGTIYLLLRN